MVRVPIHDKRIYNYSRSQTAGHTNRIIAYTGAFATGDHAYIIYTFNNYREVFSSWEAFFGWKQPEEAPHMLVSSILSTIL